MDVGTNVKVCAKTDVGLKRKKMKIDILSLTMKPNFLTLNTMGDCMPWPTVWGDTPAVKLQAKWLARG